MNDRDLLLRAILGHPADDTPRLIYADALDEAGGPANAARAAFIRLQIETEHLYAVTERWATTSGTTEDEAGEAGSSLAEGQHLERESAKLLKEWGAEWLPEPGRTRAKEHFGLSQDSWGEDTPTFVTAGITNRTIYEFSRGFVRSARTDFDIFRQAEPLDIARCTDMLGRALTECPIEVYVFSAEARIPLVRANVRRFKKGWRCEFRAIYAKRDYIRRTHAAVKGRDEFCAFVAQRFPAWLGDTAFEIGNTPY